MRKLIADRSRMTVALLMIVLFVVALVVMLSILALAAEGSAAPDPTGDPGEISLGQYSIPVLIMVFLSIVFNFLAIGDRWKPLIAICFGVGLALVAIPYNQQPWTLVIMIDYALYGLMAGCAAVGLYEGQKALRASHRG